MAADIVIEAAQAWGAARVALAKAKASTMQASPAEFSRKHCQARTLQREAAHEEMWRAEAALDSALAAAASGTQEEAP